MAQNRGVDAALAGLWYPELLILNCGSSAACVCPPDYPNQVEYRDRTGSNWNLNAGIKGPKGVEIASDTINLCWRRGKYVAAPTLGSGA